MTLSLLAALASWASVYAVAVRFQLGVALGLAITVALLASKLLAAHAVMYVVRARLPVPTANPHLAPTSTAPSAKPPRRGCGCAGQTRAA
jgi:hypothetical protein